MKTCRSVDCQVKNPKFNKNSNSKDGLQSYCKTCQTQRAAAWNLANKERNITNKKKWYEENAESSIAKSIEWHKVNSKKDKENAQRRAKENPTLRARIGKNSKLKKKFGISISEYDLMFASQGGCCAICKEQEKAIDKRTNKPRALAVDHCHTTGAVRQLLCNRCNHVLGLIKDNIDLCDNIKVYLCQNKK